MAKEENAGTAAAVESKQPEVYIDNLEGSTRLPDEPEPVEEVEKKEDPKEEGVSEAEELEPKETPKPGDIEYTEKVKKRIGEVTRQKNDAIRDAEYWKAKALEKTEAKPAEVKTAEAAVNKPKEEDFDTTADFVEAYTNWNYDKRKAADAETTKSEQDQISQQDSLKTFNERVEASGIKDRVENYDELIDTSGAYTPAMKQLVLESEQGPELALYLAQNTEVSQAISKMSPMGAAKEIGKLEMKLTQKPTRKTVTNAADPITPLNGNDVPAIDLQTCSQAEYEKSRGY